MSTAPAAPGDRLHALDNLRALMMWLGIVLHAAANHITGPALLPWRDRATHLGADVLCTFIHSFRMPVFLMLAGYMARLLVEHRGAQGMLRHRMRRLALPFVVFWPVIYGLTAVLVMLYVHQIVHGRFGLDPDIVPRLPHAPTLNTMHLWFMYQLVGLVLLSVGALWLGRRHAALQGLGQRVLAALAGLAQKPWGFAVLAVPLALIGATYPLAILMVTGSFAPPLAEWLHHGLFFLFGWCLHAHRERLLPLLSQRATRMAWGGLPLFIIALGLMDQVFRQPDSGPAVRLAAGWAYNATTWLWSLAAIGLGLRLLDRANPALRYLADSSYWVYLVHMLGTIGFGALLYSAPLPALVKLLLNITATTLVALLSYQLLVRNTAIGQLLNGRRIPG